MSDNTINKKILQDAKASGKERPWRAKKMKNLTLSKSMHRLGMHKKANRVWWCGQELEFEVDGETGEKRLKQAHFCRERLCPMCQWRRSLKIICQVGKVMDRAQEDYKDLVPIFLTLTVRNCKGDNLGGELDAMFKGWHLLFRRRKLKRFAKGWFRALEVTYNEDADTYHPHLHAIVMVDKSYFSGSDYMKTEEWVQMWGESLRADYRPVCYLRKIRSGKGKRKAVAEVAKYTLKDASIFGGEEAKVDKLVSVLGSALKGRRLYAFGGLLKDLAKQMCLEGLEEGDFIHGDEQVRFDLAELIEKYSWSFGLSNYLLSEVRVPLKEIIDSGLVE